MLFQPPGPAKRPRPALLSKPRTMLSQLAGSPVSLRPAVVLHEFATCSRHLPVRQCTRRWLAAPMYTQSSRSLRSFGWSDHSYTEVIIRHLLPAAHMFQARSIDCMSSIKISSSTPCCDCMASCI